MGRELLRATGCFFKRTNENYGLYFVFEMEL